LPQGQLAGLLEALQMREQERARLEAEQAAVRAWAPLRVSDARRVRSEPLTLAASWRTVLADDPMHARPIISSLLKGRVTFTPMEHPKEWEVRGSGTLVEMFSRLFVQGVARPQGRARLVGSQRTTANSIITWTVSPPETVLATVLVAQIRDRTGGGVIVRSDRCLGGPGAFVVDRSASPALFFGGGDGGGATQFLDDEF
jgi:hypothetical protein